MSKIPEFTSANSAEIAFYKAFAECDFKAMETIWADEEIICIHPGSSAVVGHEAVMRSWVNILANAEPPNLKINVISRTTSDDLAIHVVQEYISAPDAYAEDTYAVLATNVYRNDKNHGWRLLEHHASVPTYMESDVTSPGDESPSNRTLQ